MLTNPGWLRATRRFDARLRMVRGAPHALKHNEGVTFHLFTSETTARVRLLDADRLQPGSEGWVQVLLDDPVPMVKGDFLSYVHRRTRWEAGRLSTQTLGGGTAVSLRKYWTGSLPWTPAPARMSSSRWPTNLGRANVRTLSQRSNLSEAEVLARLSELTEQGEVVALGELGVQADAVVYSRRGWDIVRNPGTGGVADLP